MTIKQSIPRHQAADGDGLKARLRVLVVEDDTDCAQSMAVLLRIYGHCVETTSDSTTALAAIRREAVDVVLLDIGLPGINGWELAQQIKQRCGKKPLLVAISGYARQEDRQHSLAAGIDLHFAKPLDPVRLETLLRRLADGDTLDKLGSAFDS